MLSKLSYINLVIREVLPTAVWPRRATQYTFPRVALSDSEDK